MFSDFLKFYIFQSLLKKNTMHNFSNIYHMDELKQVVKTDPEQVDQFFFAENYGIANTNA